MRLGRIASPDGVAFVVIEGDPNSDAVCKEIAEQYLSRNPTFTGRSWPLADVRLLAPIVPRNIIAVGLNYKSHLSGRYPEQPVPGLFLKGANSIIGPGDPIPFPKGAEVALCHGNGGLLSCQTTALLGSAATL